MSIKTYLAECIRKIATQGQFSHDELVAAAARSIQADNAAGCLAQVNAQDLDRHWMLLPSMLSKPAFQTPVGWRGSSSRLVISDILEMTKDRPDHRYSFLNSFQQSMQWTYGFDLGPSPLASELTC